MLNSAAGVTLPSQQGAPPITTSRETCRFHSGLRRSARRDVCQRTKRDDFQTRIFFDDSQDRFHSIFGLGTSPPRSKPVITKSVKTMKPVRCLERSPQRLLRSAIDRNI